MMLLQLPEPHLQQDEDMSAECHTPQARRECMVTDEQNERCCHATRGPYGLRKGLLIGSL